VFWQRNELPLGAAGRGAGEVKGGGVQVGAGRGPAVEFRLASLDGGDGGVELGERGLVDLREL